MNSHVIWATALVIVVLVLCGTLIYLNRNPYIFEIGDNALEGIKSMNWSALVEAGRNCSCEL